MREAVVSDPEGRDLSIFEIAISAEDANRRANDPESWRADVAEDLLFTVFIRYHPFCGAMAAVCARDGAGRKGRDLLGIAPLVRFGIA